MANAKNIALIIPTAEMSRLLNVDEKIITTPLVATIKELGELAQKTAVSHAPGHFASSIVLEAEPLMARVHTPLKQARTLEGGRGQNKRFPPIDEIDAWLAGQGMPPEATFPIAQAIAKRGFKGRWFMKKAKAAVLSVLPERVSRLTQEIEDRWVNPYKGSR